MGSVRETQRDLLVQNTAVPKVFDQCVLPVMTYGSETWPLNIGLMKKLKVAQRAMERAVLGVSLRDMIRYTVICKRTDVTVRAQRVGTLK